MQKVVDTEALASLPSLEYLQLRDCSFHGNELTHLSRLTSLTSLAFYGKEQNFHTSCRYAYLLPHRTTTSSIRTQPPGRIIGANATQWIQQQQSYIKLPTYGRKAPD